MKRSKSVKKLKIDRKKIALIHVAKKQLGLSDDEYRLALGSVGVESSKDLFSSQFNRLMQHFERAGFVSKGAKARRGEKSSARTSKQAMQRKIRAIMADLGLTDSYVDAMARKMFKIDCWIWATTDQTHKIVAALTYYQRRRQA